MPLNLNKNFNFPLKFSTLNYFPSIFFLLKENANWSLRHFHFSSSNKRENFLISSFILFFFLHHLIFISTKRKKPLRALLIPYRHSFFSLSLTHIHRLSFHLYKQSEMGWKYYINNSRKKNFHHNSSLAGTHMCMTDEHSRVKMRWKIIIKKLYKKILKFE